LQASQRLQKFLAQGSTGVKKIKIILTDLQDNQAYRGYIDNPTPFALGGNLIIPLSNTNPPREWIIRGLRGWLFSDTGKIVILMDAQGKRFKVQISQK
jgi:hypothetical protein